MPRLLPALAGAILAIAPAWADDLPLMVTASPIRLALAPAYHVKPPDMFIPADAKPGAIARVIRPFGSWTLVCDNDFAARRRVCMASQTLLDQSGQLAFSWSLVGSDGAGPVMILRAPADADVQSAHIVLGPTETRVVALRTCDAELCLGYLRVDADIARAIKQGASVTVATVHMPATPTTLAGLDGAIASIR